MAHVFGAQGALLQTGQIYATQPLYLLQMYCVKMSFLLLYLQIFPQDMRKLRVALYASFVLLALSFVSTFCMDMFYCVPVSRNW